jgi:hypothetical protein
MDWKWADPAAETSGDTKEKSTLASTETKTVSKKGSTARKWLIPVLAMAACVAVTFVLAREWPREADVQIASLTRKDQATRGVRDMAVEVKNSGRESAFVTVVGLVPNQPFLPIHYRQDNRFLEVPAQGTIVVTNLPPEFEKAESLLYILTRSPSPEAIRHSYPENPGVDRPLEFADQLRRNLRTLNVASDIRVLDVSAKK